MLLRDLPVKTVSLPLFTIFTLHSVNLPRNLSDDLWFIVHTVLAKEYRGEKAFTQSVFTRVVLHVQ